MPIVDGILLSLTTSGLELEDNVFIVVELFQSTIDNSYVTIINLIGLGSIAEVHEGANCSDKFSGGWPTNHAYEVTLHITMDAASNLFQFGDAALVVLKPYSRL